MRTRIWCKIHKQRHSAHTHILCWIASSFRLDSLSKAQKVYDERLDEVHQIQSTSRIIGRNFSWVIQA
jgi:hypothetical protein